VRSSIIPPLWVKIPLNLSQDQVYPGKKNPLEEKSLVDNCFSLPDYNVSLNQHCRNQNSIVNGNCSVEVDYDSRALFGNIFKTIKLVRVKKFSMPNPVPEKH